MTIGGIAVSGNSDRRKVRQRGLRSVTVRRKTARQPTTDNGNFSVHLRTVLLFYHASDTNTQADNAIYDNASVFEVGDPVISATPSARTPFTRIRISGHRIWHFRQGSTAAPLLRAPQLTAVSTTATTTTGVPAGQTKDTQFAPSTSYTLEFFATSTADSLGEASGESYLGNATVTTDATGTASFTVTLPEGVDPTDIVTATATNQSTGDTSQFSSGFKVAGQTWPVTSTADSDPAPAALQPDPRRQPASASSRTDRRSTTIDFAITSTSDTGDVLQRQRRAYRSHPPARCPPSRMRCSSMATANLVPRRTATVPPRVT